PRVGALCHFFFSPNNPTYLHHSSSSSSTPTKLFIFKPTTFISSRRLFLSPHIVYWLAVAPALSTRLPSAATPTPASYAASPFHQPPWITPSSPAWQSSQPRG